MGEITFNFCFSVESSKSAPSLVRLHKQVGLQEGFLSQKQGNMTYSPHLPRKGMDMQVFS